MTRLTSPWHRLIATWLIFATSGVLSIALTATSEGSPPLFFSAGLGLACVIGWGRGMVWAVGAGGASVTLFYCLIAPSSPSVPTVIALTLWTGFSAGLQAWVAMKLTATRAAEGLTLENPRRILSFLLRAGPMACVVSAGMATLGVTALGIDTVEQPPHFFFNWWVGNILGVLIGTPMLLPLVGQPAQLWRPRMRVVTIPLLITAVLLIMSVRHFGEWSSALQQAFFKQAVQATSKELSLRLASHVHAVDALHGLMDGSDNVTQDEFERVTQYWLQALPHVQGMGWLERERMSELLDFEATQRRQGLSNFKVHDGLERRPPRGEEVVVMRLMAPLADNQGALGLNILSLPESRAAYQLARDTGMTQANHDFPWIRDNGAHSEVVIYRAVYAGTPQTVEERRRSVKGAVFVRLRIDDAMSSLLHDLPPHLAACLYESHAYGRRLLTGSPACGDLDTVSKLRHAKSVPISFAAQPWTLQVSAQAPIPLTGDLATFWLLTVCGTLLAAALGTLLLVVTGNARHLEEAMREARRLHAAADQANRAKSEFLSRMSHELRTPLNAVLGFAQVMDLDSRAPLPPSQANRVQQIQQAGWHLLDMIDDVLDISRVDSGTMRLNCQPISVADALSAAANLVNDQARKRGIAIHWPGHIPSDWGVDADATRLRQILTNLLSNAIKYNRPQGSVKVSVTHHADDTPCPTVRIAVTDTGLGLSASQQSQLFQPFNRLGRERSAMEGTGIGLVISRHLAVLMNGDIEVDSRENEGSTFTLVLPAVSLAHTDVAPDEPRHQTDAEGHASPLRHVLYVEGKDGSVGTLRQSLFEHSGMRASMARSAEETLALLHSPQLGVRPDLIVLNTHLPDASGLELLKLIKANPNTAAIPVIMVSAEAPPEVVQAAMTSGADRHHAMPVHVAALLEDIDALLPA